MYGMITRSQYRFPKVYWDHVSPEAIACVRGLMHVDPQQRLNCDTLCQHPFILKHVDLQKLEEEEDALLRKQQALMQNSSSSLLLPPGVRIPYRPSSVVVESNEQNRNDDDDCQEEHASTLSRQVSHLQSVSTSNSNVNDDSPCSVQQPGDEVQHVTDSSSITA
ncbi:hypothetical protein RFI_21835 [Reticulomyxa filosa]|uniref:Protein kinase domain-containing protein n=1 Tax=Reticulomyxa filosa TaxID=46433 RepID=X6MNF2_RETFI|nr:hypothetical protein RFI_21835 [Reticulomyxa filosa]|eukprot:ETO15528.1 hypothetical protein RFI_21835 [Reticulomyxa filosa]